MIPIPPPMLKNLIPYFDFSCLTSGATFPIAAAKGADSVICEPMCICRPTMSMLRIFAARS